MKIRGALSNGGSIQGTFQVEIEGPAIDDTDALNLAQQVLGSDYVTAWYSQDSGTPTLEYLEVTDLNRTVPLS